MIKRLSKTTAIVLTLLLGLAAIFQMGSDEEPTETIFTVMDTQVGPTWGLDRVDGAVDGLYTYISSGSGVRIYVVDTGIDATHREFGSRVVDGFDAFGENLDQVDCNGHGTHVAGVAAGSYYGVAKYATLVPVRVLDCDGRGSASSLLAGIDWILTNHPGGLGVVNMSLGGDKDVEVNLATAKLVSAGLVVVVAAGNSNVDACTFSPASAPGVIAVGATDMSDKKASFSNWGSCVDVFSPGVSINSANATDHSVSSRRSGTSQASPFVAGAIATYISSGSIINTSTVEDYLEATSEKDSVRESLSPRSNILNVEKPPAVEEPVGEEEPVIEPPVIEPPVIEPPVIDPPVIDPPVIEEPVIEEPIIEEPIIEEPIIEEPVIEEPVIEEPVDEVELFVSVTQSAPGSGRAVLEWSQIPEAGGYKIYKTGSIRPSWRLYASVSKAAFYRNIIDKPGEVAIYRVVALVDTSEVEIGIFEYYPE